MLTEDLMRKVKELQIRTGRAVNEVFAGEYSSAFKGRGMEFAEVRQYQPGDDVRTIDWNVTARTGEPHVKRFIEERELTVVLAVDLSASGRFGSRRRIKNETAAELCAVLAFAATRSNDKAGLLIFTDGVELFIPPKKGLRHALRLIREVLEFGSARADGSVRRGRASASRGKGTDMVGALEHLNRMLRRRAVIFVVSDFLVPGAGVRRTDQPNAFETALRVLSRRHDVIATVISDPRERELPARRGGIAGLLGAPAGLLELEDAETGRRLVIDAGSAVVARQYAREAHDFRRRLEQQMRRLGVDLLRIDDPDSYIHEMVRLFRTRERRRAGR